MSEPNPSTKIKISRLELVRRLLGSHETVALYGYNIERLDERVEITGLCPRPFLRTYWEPYVQQFVPGELGLQLAAAIFICQYGCTDPDLWAANDLVEELCRALPPGTDAFELRFILERAFEELMQKHILPLGWRPGPVRVERDTTRFDPAKVEDPNDRGKEPNVFRVTHLCETWTIGDSKQTMNGYRIEWPENVTWENGGSFHCEPVSGIANIPREKLESLEQLAEVKEGPWGLSLIAAMFVHAFGDTEGDCDEAKAMLRYIVSQTDQDSDQDDDDLDRDIREGIDAMHEFFNASDAEAEDDSEDAT